MGDQSSQRSSTHADSAGGSSRGSQSQIKATASPALDGDITVISSRTPQPADPALRQRLSMEQAGLIEGDHLGQFQLEKYIGGGGMGVVFRAIDTTLNRSVAVKVLSHKQATDEESLRRFRNEAQSAARLNHENIARVHYVGEDRGVHYIVFEFIDGVNVRDLVERVGPLPLKEAVSYTWQVALALEHAHERDVIHRDIKPSNMLVTSDGKAKLVDMGLARLNQMAAADDDLTASGVTLGTFDYISPEQARDPRSADTRSDMYSLGCSYFYMLTGRPPFPDGTMLQKLLQHQGDQPPDARSFRPDLPAEVTRILAKMLAKSPAQRYQQPAELIAELAQLGEKLGITSVASPSVWTQPRSAFRARWQRHRPWLIPLAALFAIVLGLDYYWSRGGESAAVNTDLPNTANKLDPIRRNGAANPAGAVGPSTEAGRGNAVDRDAINRREPNNERATSATPGGAALAPATDGAKSRNNTESQTTPDEPLPSAESASPGAATDWSASRERVLVVGDDGGSAYPTLYAACHDAHSGDIIELRYNGRRAERPIVLSNVKVSIRAGEGFQPVVVFRPAAEQISHPGFSPGLLTVIGGQLRAKGVHWEVDLPRNAPADWSLFEASRSELLRFDRCTFTIHNASQGESAYHSDVAFFDIQSTADAATMGIDLYDVTDQVVTIELQDCIVRGEATVLRCVDQQSVQFYWNNGLLATSERLVRATGGLTAVSHLASLDVHMQNVTARIREGLAMITDSEDAPFQLPTTFRCHDCVFVARVPVVFIEQRGVDTVDEFRELFEWHGANNWFDGFEIFWQIISSANLAETSAMRFAQWDARFPGGVDVATREQNIWLRLPPTDRAFHTHTPADYALNQAALQAAPGQSEPGFVLRRLPTLFDGDSLNAAIAK